MSSTHTKVRRFHVVFWSGLCAAMLFNTQIFARPFAPAFSCARLKGMIQSNGAMVLSTGKFTYDRFVRDQSFCTSDEITEPAWIISSDSAECYIGSTCGEREPGVN